MTEKMDLLWRLKTLTGKASDLHWNAGNAISL